MALDIDSISCHLREMVPGQPPSDGVDLIGIDEEGGGVSVFHQNGKGEFVNGIVVVIDRDHRRLLGDGPLRIQKIEEQIHGDDPVSVLFQISHLFFKDACLYGHRIGFISGKSVVREHRDRLITLWAHPSLTIRGQGDDQRFSWFQGDDAVCFSDEPVQRRIAQVLGRKGRERISGLSDMGYKIMENPRRSRRSGRTIYPGLGLRLSWSRSRRSGLRFGLGRKAGTTSREKRQEDEQTTNF